ncbi:MAG: phosphoribosylglycinamide formyltransferase [Dysgonamonadaceae bacterium]|jgi:phosphoribosylglycinamide formyltransferase-1|nr:phosphoribosylglycinamide formyltransferase [Dysgonamonadaceae bacterium]
MTNIAIFASGSGSNAENIADYFSENSDIRICLIVSNKADAFVHERAKKLGIPSLTYPKSEFEEGTRVLEILREYGINFIVLAGFLLKIPGSLIEAYPRKIVNIHPALLPKYGGKGMYGEHVHKAVVAAGEKESGITIHYVNEHYDEGQVIFQAKCDVSPTDTPENVAQKVHELEYRHFPEAIEKTILSAQK